MQKPLIVSVTSPAFGDADVHVVSAEGRDAISVLFDLDLLVTCPVDLDHKKVLASALTVSFHKDDKLVRHVHGMAASIREIVTADTKQRNYRIRLVPRMWKGTLNERIDIYMDMSAPEIVQKKLEEIGLEQGDDFMFKLRGTYDKREFVVQYRESDVAFISRLTEQLGISFSFEHTTGRDVVVFSDDNGAFQPIDDDHRVGLRTAVGDFGVQTLESRTTHTPGKYIVRDYNYRTPSVDLTGDKVVEEGSGGVIVEYGAHFKTPEEGKWVAGVRAQEIEAQRFVHDGTGTNPRFRAGATFTLEGHPRGELELLITDVTHRVRQSSMGGATTEPVRYEMTFSAISQNTTYRPPRRTPKPKVHGVLTGIIDTAAKGQYAELDPEGRYRVKFLCDTAETPDALASRPVRMAQPHAGAGYGMHFPLRQGVEVVLTCVDGDPDRPIIASTVPNPSTPSPVTGGNKARNIIRTGGGNEINIDDSDGEHRIKMSTPHKGTLFQLGSPNFNEAGAALATAGAYTTQVEGIASAISGVSSAVDECMTHLSADIITTASPINIDWTKVAKAVTGAVKGVVAAANNFREIGKTRRENEANRTAARSKELSNALAFAKRRLPPESAAAKLQTEVESAMAALLLAEQELHGAKEELRRHDAALDDLPVAANDDEGPGLNTEANLKRAKRDHAKHVEYRKQAEVNELKKKYAAAALKRDQAMHEDGSISLRDRLAIQNGTDNDLEGKRTAADATNDKAAFEKGLKSGWLKTAAAAADGAAAVASAVDAADELWSTWMKWKNRAQKAAGIATTETHAVSGRLTANNALFTKFTAARAVSTPFNIMDSHATSAVVSLMSTVIGSGRSVTVSGNKIGVGAVKELVMSSRKDAELFGRKHVALSSNTLFDVYSKKKGRVVVHSDKELAPYGEPDLFVGAKKELELLSDDKIRAWAQNDVHIIAEKKRIVMETRTQDFKLQTKTDTTIAAEGGAYLAAKKELKLAGAETWGAVCDAEGAFLGQVTTSTSASEISRRRLKGVSIDDEKVETVCGDAAIELHREGRLKFQGTEALEAKVSGSTIEINPSKILLG